MKKIIITMLIAVLCMTAFAGCSCEHEWSEATCTEPKTCSLCAETEGEPSGHSWTEATCSDPKTCESCKLTEGSALEHSWTEATEEAPKTCTLCGLTEGEPLAVVNEEAEEFFASDGFTVVSYTIESGLSVNHTIEYEYVNDPQNPTPVLYIYLSPLAGAADAYTADRAMWSTFTENVRTFSERASIVFEADNHMVACCVTLLDDRDAEKALYVVINGVVAYDFLAE